MSADTVSDSRFTEHSIESAPPAARRFMTATRDHLGYLPAGMARMATSPSFSAKPMPVASSAPRPITYCSGS